MDVKDWSMEGSEGGRGRYWAAEGWRRSVRGAWRDEIGSWLCGGDCLDSG